MPECVFTRSHRRAQREPKQLVGYLCDGENFHRGHRAAYETPPERVMAAAQLALFFFHRRIDWHRSDLHGFDHKLTPAARPPLHTQRAACCYSECRRRREMTLLRVSFLWPPIRGAGIKEDRPSRGRCRYPHPPEGV